MERSEKTFLTKCPVCGNSKLTGFIKTKDYFLSEEDFDILQCDNCRQLFTNPQPNQNIIGNYYKSENYLSHPTSKKDLTAALYNFVKGFSIKRKYRIIKKYSSGKTVLDVGCGSGEFASYCRAKGWEVSGVEPAREAREYARSVNRINVFEGVERLDSEKLKFDVITLWHVLEHFPDPKKKLHELTELLNSGGTVILAVPNCRSFDALHYKKYWAGYDVPRHLFHFNKETISNVLSTICLTTKAIIPMKYDSFYVSLLSEKYKRCNTPFPKALFMGLISNVSAIINGEYSSLIFVVKKS